MDLDITPGMTVPSLNVAKIIHAIMVENVIMIMKWINLIFS